MKLKPLLFLAGAAGAAAAVIKRRGGAEQLAQAVPEPVRSAAQQAGETVQRAAQSAPAPIREAVEKATPGGGQAETKVHERYEPPAEGLAQPPTEPGGRPSSDAPVREASPTVSEPGAQLNVPEHGAPEGAVMPDTATDDPLVRRQEKAAAGDAGAIGGNVDEMAADDASFPEDPAMRPVVEGAGDENEETFEAREEAERSHRETET